MMNMATDMMLRLASAIPIHKNDDSITDVLRIFLNNSTKAQVLLDLVILTIIVVLALELLSNAVYHVPKAIEKVPSIPVRGKHLDNFSIKDKVFITFNKCMTGLFVYCYFGYLWSVRMIVPTTYHEHNVNPIDRAWKERHLLEHQCCGYGKGIWNLKDISLANTLLPLPFLFLIYDLIYTLLHWFLHTKLIYAYIHKHHHFQKAPSRANVDAVNVHPLEFFLGEFNHILALHLVIRGMPSVGFYGLDVSWIGALLFIALGGVLAGLNHTRHDVVIRVPKMSSNQWICSLFDSKHHDVHHRIPQCNYGQYTVLWDRIFGTFREYDENDRVNPAHQLDPHTGKTVK